MHDPIENIADPRGTNAFSCTKIAQQEHELMAILNMINLPAISLMLPAINLLCVTLKYGDFKVHFHLEHGGQGEHLKVVSWGINAQRTNKAGFAECSAQKRSMQSIAVHTLHVISQETPQQQNPILKL